MSADNFSVVRSLIPSSRALSLTGVFWIRSPLPEGLGEFVTTHSGIAFSEIMDRHSAANLPEPQKPNLSLPDITSLLPALQVSF
jgi:hypothetical protein